MPDTGETDWQPVTQRPYDRDGPEDLTTTVIEAIAAAEGVDVVAIRDPPLYDVVDIAAIEAGCFGSAVTGKRRDPEGVVEFQYYGYRVRISSDGWVTVLEPASREP